MGRRESPIETHFVERCEACDGLVRKVTYQGRKGAPDRWAFFPHERLLIVELKGPGEKPEPLQLEEMRLLRERGFSVAWTDSKAGVDDILETFFLFPEQFDGRFRL